MDEKKLEEIRARHEMTREDAMGNVDGADARRDRGWLLQAITEAQATERQARSLLQRARWWVADLPASEHDNGTLGASRIQALRLARRGVTPLT